MAVPATGALKDELLHGSKASSNLLNPLVNGMRRVSAASVDSQFPVDPRYAGPRAG
jgi:hypothetical protein